MKTIFRMLLIICLFAVTIPVFAQDIIFLKNGDEIKAKVEELSVDKVKYRKFANLNGPLYSTDLSEVIKIKYENGTEDVFSKTTATQSSSVFNSSNISQKRIPTTGRSALSNVSTQLPERKKDSKVRFGFEAGLNISNINSENYKPGGDYDDWVVNPNFGVNLGLLLEFKLSDLISIQPELKISMKGCTREGYSDLYDADNDDIISVKDAYEEWHLNFTYLEFPINLLFNLSAGKGNFLLGGGPYLAYGIAGKSNSIFTKDGETVPNVVNANYDLFKGEYKSYNPFDFGVNVLAGYEFSNGIFVKAGYALGLVTIVTKELDEPTPSVKNGCFDISLGYKF